MDINDTKWTATNTFYTALVILVVIIFLLTSLNVANGPTREVTGIVTSVGTQSATIYQLPYPILTVALKSGEKVIVNGNRSINHQFGDKVVILESKRLLTSGTVYSFSRLSE